MRKVYTSLVVLDFCVFNNGLFFELPCETQNDTNCKKLPVCALCIPPEGSVYSNSSSFTELEETLLHINLDNVLIIGDLNARTGDSSDYIWDTAALDNILDDVGTTELMKMYNIQQDRRSQDVGKNNFGHALIDVCISQRLLIVYGRDADLGKLTCRSTRILNSNNRQKKHTVAMIFLLSILRSWATSPRKNFFIHLITKLIYLYTMI